ncbi:serine-type endopeptidase [Aureococcus anophagefferens]|nr:serine-type endopeptidase [Aureococcus anophagefferens]
MRAVAYALVAAVAAARLGAPPRRRLEDSLDMEKLSEDAAVGALGSHVLFKLDGDDALVKRGDAAAVTAKVVGARLRRRPTASSARAGKHRRPTPPSASTSGHEESKTCAWVEKPKSRCKDTIKSRDGVTASVACPEACDACPADVGDAAPCEDSPTWYQGKKTTRTCAWVAKKPEKYCAFESRAKVPASAACPVACDSCPGRPGRRLAAARQYKAVADSQSVYDALRRFLDSDAHDGVVIVEPELDYAASFTPGDRASTRTTTASASRASPGGDSANSGAKLMVSVGFGKTRNGGFAEALLYGADNGAQISSNSWGYTNPGAYSQSVLNAIDY